jgi:hypothetical protein
MSGRRKPYAGTPESAGTAGRERAREVSRSRTAHLQARSSKNEDEPG